MDAGKTLVSANCPPLVQQPDTGGGKVRQVSVPLDLTFWGEETENKWVCEQFSDFLV